MTVDQVADYLQLNRLTVYRYIREGRIPASRIGKLYRVLKADVDRFLEAQKVGQRAAGPRRPGEASRPPAHAGRPQAAGPPPEQVFVGPPWRERVRDREQRDFTALGTYPFEWVMRGLH
ncbi:MAG: helix-turn-helix domain-containing protein [Armatimonadota bacterium]|nr:helix-turn-helix domain-containing protein [Armatimonadota bacterium]